MNEIIKDILVKARALIKDPKHWTKGDAAKDEYGAPVMILSPRACTFCSLGALYKAANIVDSSLFDDAKETLSAYMGIIALYNDDEKTKHKDIMRAFNCAIKEVST